MFTKHRHSKLIVLDLPETQLWTQNKKKKIIYHHQSRPYLCKLSHKHINLHTLINTLIMLNFELCAFPITTTISHPCLTPCYPHALSTIPLLQGPLKTDLVPCPKYSPLSMLIILHFPFHSLICYHLCSILIALMKNFREITKNSSQNHNIHVKVVTLYLQRPYFHQIQKQITITDRKA